MPCDSLIIFWTFRNGYFQFYRGGSWIYDTVVCSDGDTGLVKLWVVTDENGLNALEGEQGKCGLARLIAINYDE